ncbi:MAG: VTT domain-containing protein [Thermoanaerobaculia bacterium]|nr:VTT domain-containing protein [Thermoanaerobaculia bacterium]
MDELRELLSFLTDPQQLIRWGGYIGLFAIVFTETGLMFGFFLPGDSLLVTAGLFASKGDLDIFLLNALLIVAAITGDATGYLIGRRMGPALYRRQDSRFFRRAHLIKTRLFYEKHGGKTIVIARFVPIIRTFAPVVAGVAGMEYRRFALFNIFGGIGWVVSMTMTGFLLGRLIPNIDKHIEIMILVVIAISFIPAVLHGWKERKEKLHLRKVFLSDVRHLATKLREVNWSSPVEATLEELRHPAEDRSETVIPDPAAFEFRSAADGEQIPRIELTAAVSADRHHLTDAGYDFAMLDFEEKFKIAVEAIADQFHQPETVVSTPDHEVTAHLRATHAAVWRYDDGRLILARIHDPLRDRFRIAMVAEPLPAAPGATT